MAYQLRDEKGVPFMKKGQAVLATNVSGIKLMELDEKNKTFVAVASTEDEDRDKDIVRQSGWKMTNFRKNPVVPWSHNYYGVPIARSMKTWVDKQTNRLLFMPKFDDSDDESVKIFNKYKNGFLTSFSVGFMGLKSEYRDEDDKWWGGREFLQQELLEISCCAIPANPNANVHMGMDENDKGCQNLITLGYPEVFARTKSGLFYPVMDIAVFTQPKEFEIEEGVTAIKAVPLDEDLSVKNPVAYLFDPEQFDDKTANEWIKENVEQEWKTKYFDVKVDNKGNIALEKVEEDCPIKLFETSVSIDVDVSKDLPDSEDDTDKDLSLEDGEKNTDTDETSISDDQDNKSDADDDADVEDKTDATGDAENDLETEDKDTGTPDDQVVVLNRSIEIVKTLKDMEGNVLDKQVITIGTNAKLQSISEYDNIEANKLISLLKDEIELLKRSIAELTDKKDLDNPNEITDNTVIETQDLDATNDSATKNDDLIELDDSLISPANEKTNSDTEFIEIDADELKNSKSGMVDSVKSSLTDILREKLSEALQSVSGKID